MILRAECVFAEKVLQGYDAMNACQDLKVAIVLAALVTVEGQSQAVNVTTPANANSTWRMRPARPVLLDILGYEPKILMVA